jgi:hypothetical protein
MAAGFAGRQDLRVHDVDGKSMNRIPDLTPKLEQAGVGGKVLLTMNRNGLQVPVVVADIASR